MTNSPLVSVIMPAHNNADTIERAIASVLAQTHANLEVIVVDDHSTDKTRAVVERMARADGRVRFVALTEIDSYRYDERLKRNVNAGYAARNRGFKEARGAYLTFQDADDASLLNRIEIQLALLARFNALHLSVAYLPLEERYLGRRIDAERYLRDHPDAVTGPEELYLLAARAKGLVAKVVPRLNARVPFRYKRLRILNKLFFGSLDPYPGAGNCPLFAREVIERVRFRRLPDRVWPSFMGRGADRDFNFQVAETFKRSCVVRIPAYLWDNRANHPSPVVEPYLL
jgi:glycosyltransferase involved in cell wall biosynthesis